MFTPQREHSDITNLIESYLFEITGREILILPGLSQSVIESHILQRWSEFIELFEREDKECLNYLQNSKSMSTLFDILLRVTLTKKQLEFYLQFTEHLIPSEKQILSIFSCAYTTNKLYFQSSSIKLFTRTDLKTVLISIYENINAETIESLLFVNDIVFEEWGMIFDILPILLKKNLEIINILHKTLRNCICDMRLLLSKFVDILLFYNDEEKDEEIRHNMRTTISNLHNFLVENDIIRSLPRSITNKLKILFEDFKLDAK